MVHNGGAKPVPDPITWDDVEGALAWLRAHRDDPRLGGCDWEGAMHVLDDCHRAVEKGTPYPSVLTTTLVCVTKGPKGKPKGPNRVRTLGTDINLLLEHACWDLGRAKRIAFHAAEEGKKLRFSYEDFERYPCA